MNITILESSKIQDPMSHRCSIQNAHLAATKEEWGYTIIKDRFNFYHNVDMTHQEFWSYVKTLESRWFR
jgi:hypothetical protein